ncbi:MAG: metal ABC transporter solute-binding protein, Zn/Mn family [Phocaeicola sp.]
MRLRNLSTLSIVTLFLLLTILTGCGSKRSQSTKKQIMVTMEPLRYFAEAIAGDSYKIISMVPDGSSPETYDPIPQQLIELAQCEAYIKIGYIGFEMSWMEKIKTNNKHLKIFDTSKGIDLIKDSAHEHHVNCNHPGGIEPHTWNSTKNAVVIASHIFEALCELNPTDKAIYQHRLDSVKQLIATTDQEVRHSLEHADSTFLIYHPALSYFARDYGLTQISIEENGKEPSPAQLKRLIERCREAKARVIFVQQEFDTRNAEVIAKEIGVEVVPINPLSYHWHDEMIHIAKALHHGEQ